MTIEELYNIVQKRKKEMPKNSYTTSLFKSGRDRIVQKVGEEATEVIIAVKNNSKKEIVYEVADLWFHTLVLLSEFNIEPKSVFEELEKRNIKNGRINVKKNV